MLEVYKFFGIRETFARKLHLITAGRNATIKFDDCSLSRSFALETGAPQGNSPSPIQYNLCEQIAIIKIELDPRIASVYNHHLVPELLPVLLPVQAPVPVPAPDPGQPQPFLPVPVRGQEPTDPFFFESNRETDKVESFADDKTVTFLATPDGINAVCTILEQFATISGLFCNTDKSFIMYIGSDGPAPRFLTDYDFKLVDSITILGMKIDKKLETLQDCHLATVQKVTKIINFWDRFFLSLPGRLNIAKTLILSQVSYLGCIVTPKADTLKTLKHLINKFIVGGLNVAKDRICRPAEIGGLGMIDIDEFLVAQQIMWFKRAYISTRDNWRVDLKKIGHGNVLTVGKADVIDARFPIFTFLSESFEKFLKAFNKTNDNFSRSLLLNNPSITISQNNKRLLNMAFFTNHIPAIDTHLVCKISIENISQNNRLLSIDEITANTGINLNLILYLRLQTAFHTSQNMRRADRASDGSAISLLAFFKRFRKGSRTIQNVLSGQRNVSIRADGIRNVTTFGALVNVTLNAADEIKFFLKFWGYSFLPMNFREFSFKFFNNSLGLNHRLAHFVAGRGQGCTFCTIFNNGPISPETFIHFFYDCDTSSLMRNFVKQEFLPEILFASRQSEIKFWFYGITPLPGTKQNLFITALTQTFFYSLWRFKLQKRVPVRTSFRLEFIYNLQKIIGASRFIREQMLTIDIYLCRNWDLIRDRRG